MLSNHMTQWQGKLLGRYRLLRLLGRGGMGEVWLAEDTELHRQVAAKLLPPVLMNEKEYLRAFADEARVAASLEHPHILPVHDFGEFSFNNDDVITYLIMPLVSGGSLLDLKRKAAPGLLPVEWSLKYLRQAASAIDYAHSKHVLHRDIKPGNMLLQEDWLFLADFGIAKMLTSNTHRSRTNAGAGTPGYMAPEQIQGKAQAASDLYSLVIIAYELLSGQLPFRADDPFAVLLKHMQEPPPSPRQWNSQLPVEMEQAILKGLAKRPEQRHPTCLAFVDELEQGWRASPLSASSSSYGSNSTLLRSGGNYPPTSQPGTPATPLTPMPTPNTPFSGSIPPGYSPTRMTYQPLSIAPTSGPPPMTGGHAPSTAPGSQPGSKWPPKLSRRNATFLLGGTAAAILLAGGGFALATALPQFMKRTGPQQLIAGAPVLKLTGHTDQVWNVRWNPQGRYLVSAAHDTRVMLWNIDDILAAKQSVVQQPSVSWKLGSDLCETLLDWSPDGRTLAVLTEVMSSYVNLPEPLAIATIDVFTSGAQPVLHQDQTIENGKDPYVSLAWSPKGDTIATLTMDFSPGSIPGMQPHPGIALWQPGKADGVVKFLANTTQPTTAKRNSEDLRVYRFCWSSDASQILALDDEFNILIWQVAQDGAMQLLRLPDRWQMVPSDARQAWSHVLYRPSLLNSPTTPSLFATTNVDVVSLFDTKQAKALSLLGRDDAVANQVDYARRMNALAWSPNGRYLASSSQANPTIYIWDLQDPSPKKTSDGIQLPTLTFGATGGHTAMILDLSWSPDGRYLASASNDKTVIIWKVDAA